MQQLVDAGGYPLLQLQWLDSLLLRLSLELDFSLALLLQDWLEFVKLGEELLLFAGRLLPLLDLFCLGFRGI